MRFGTIEFDIVDVGPLLDILDLCLARANITGWAVALTCYNIISHGAKHEKMADFDPSWSQNP